MIPYGKQSISEEDITAVVNVLRSDWLTQGDMVPAFENAVASYCGAKESVAVNSATSALHLACMALGVGPGDLVWTTPITFVASANCALYCGAEVDFVDIDPKSYNISVKNLEFKLCEAEARGRLPKVVIPVHLCGQSCDMRAIYNLSERFGFKIIEDASHAIGGYYLDAPIGNCRFSDIAVFSFHPVKIITTGEGGMALTNSDKYADEMRRLRSHGITSDPSLMIHRPVDEIWNYQQISLGFNYRMTDIQAALGLSQAKRLDAFVQSRNEIASRYDNLLSDAPITLPWQHPDSVSSYHLYPIRVNKKRSGKNQGEVYRGLRACGFAVNIHYIPVYRQPFYESMGFKVGHCPEAEGYYTEAISLPIFPSLTPNDQYKITSCLLKILNN